MNLEVIFSSLGIFSLTSGQSIMLLVGLLILFLAISKKFEPLLLLPIGFGAILTNIPEIGLALSPIEKLIFSSNPAELNGVLSLIPLADAELISNFLKTASHSELWLLNEYAAELGYKPGILNTFYALAIGSGVAQPIKLLSIRLVTAIFFQLCENFCCSIVYSLLYETWLLHS